MEMLNGTANIPLAPPPAPLDWPGRSSPIRIAVVGEGWRAESVDRQQGFGSCVHTPKTIVRGGTLSAHRAHRVGPRAVRGQSLAWCAPLPPLRFRKFRSVEELETTPFIRSTCNDVVGLCSVSRLGCPIKQGKEGSVFGVEYSEQLRKKERKTLVDGYDSAVTR